MTEINANFIIGITIIVINLIPLIFRTYKYLLLTSLISVLLYFLSLMIK